MTDDERAALEDVRGYAGANRIRLTVHAITRMDQRNATYADLRHALIHGRGCRDQRDGTWVVEGVDVDGDALNVIVALRDEVVVVTLF